MSIDPQTIRAESYEALGRLVQQHAPAIVESWRLRALDDQPHGGRAREPELVDHLVRLTESIGESLQGDELAANFHVKSAIEHGLQRWQVGWSLPELVRDYQILRLVLIDFVKDTLGRPIAVREVLAIGLALDEAISASVVAYANNRDEHLRALEQRRLESEKRVQEQIQEALRQQAERLQEADRRKNEFLALLGHELRNPLGAISNATELKRMLDPRTPEYQEAQGIVERQLRHMERLVDDLLDVARIGRGAIELRRELVDWAAVAQQAVETARPLIEANRHTIDIRLPEQPLRLYGDPARLQQILSNLLINAAKYTPSGGRIVFSTERRNHQVVVRVADNGIGISAEMLPHVFDMFAQDELARRHAEGGLGLGLSLTRSLTELHGGQVEVFSDGPGRGSEFRVHLPCVEATAAAPEPPAAPAKRTANRQAKVMVVDDNRDVAQTLASLIKHHGYQVEIAHDGPSAVERAAEYRPDLLLIDIGLPGIDGYEVARRLRSLNGFDKAVLAALTGFGQEEHRQRAEEAGFDHRLVKPLRSETLLALLAQLPV